MPARRLFVASLAAATLLLTTAAAGKPAPTKQSMFRQPVFVSNSLATQAAEPSIRVDASDPNQRIWIAAPNGIIPQTRFLPATGSGDLFWYSDDDGKTWRFVTGPGGVGTPTMVGGGDSDVATGFDNAVYGTGLTLANITLAASCLNGEFGTWTTNPVSNVGTVEDRQWIDAWEDRAKPAPTAPDLVLNYGGIVERRMWFHQVLSPGCAPPVAGPRIDVSHPQCDLLAITEECYQWPGNLAVDENTGDVYVTHNTLGREEERFAELLEELEKLCEQGIGDACESLPTRVKEAPAAEQDPGTNDDVVVARVAGGAARLVTPQDVTVAIAARNRPDTFDSFTVVAVDRASNVYVVWTERHPSVQRTDTMLSVSTDRGATWSAPVRVNRSAGTQTTTFPWIVAGDPGRIDIVYYGTSERGLSPEEVPESSRWRVWMAQSLNALSPTPKFTEVPATGSMHEGPICTSGTGCAPGTRDLLDFFQIDVDAQGLANITYTDNLNTPPDPEGAGPADDDPHQEWVAYVQQQAGPRLYVTTG